MVLHHGKQKCLESRPCFTRKLPGVCNDQSSKEMGPGGLYCFPGSEPRADLAVFLATRCKIESKIMGGDDETFIHVLAGFD